jgi:hypothetical protein
MITDEVNDCCQTKWELNDNVANFTNPSLIPVVTSSCNENNTKEGINCK